MKRFYRNAVSQPANGGYEILLDGRGVKTPARQPLVAPSERLGEAIAAEWNEQGETVNPRSMPLTGLANAAIDRVAPDPEAFARNLAVFGESDLLCYRADQPRGLVARQSDKWDPLLAWARRRYDVDFEVVTGIMHRPQPDRTVSQLARAAAARGAFELAGLSPLVTVSGSLVIALALAEDEIGLETGWSAATLDEQWQLEQWGADAEAEKALDARRCDFEAGHRFLNLL
ncbi:MAG: ATPase [Pseudomonadota bacterium]|nr:ATPase [Pseudomonadota bacterium]